MLVLTHDVEKKMLKHNVIGASIAYIKDEKLFDTTTHGFIEAKTNQLVSPQTLFNACSISKFATSMLVLALIDRNVLSLDENVNNYLTSWKIRYAGSHVLETITLRHLLSHHSGILDPPYSFQDLTTTCVIPTILEVLEGQTAFCLEEITVKYSPETEFHYADANFCIIQLIIEDVMKRPFHKVMEEVIFQPLQMQKSTYSLETRVKFASGHDKNGMPIDDRYSFYPYPAAAGLWTTAGDLAQIALEMITALKGESKIGITSNLLKEMITPQFKPWTGLGIFLNHEATAKIEVTSLGWGIGYQSMLVIHPEVAEGLVIMTNSELGKHQLEGFIGDVYHSVFQ